MIELIAFQRKAFEVYFEERFIKNIHEDIFGKDMSWKNASHTNIHEFIRSKEKAGGKHLLMRKLSRKALLKSEAKRLLMDRFLDEALAEEVISELETFFDDSYLMESKIRSKLRKNLAKDRIQRDLWKAKIPEDVFEGVLEKENYDPVSQVLAFLEKTVKKEVDEAGKERLVAKLYRRGFEIDDIRYGIKMFFNKS